jgi:hypothetical protein
MNSANWTRTNEIELGFYYWIVFIQNSFFGGYYSESRENKIWPNGEGGPAACLPPSGCLTAYHPPTPLGKIPPWRKPPFLRVLESVVADSGLASPPRCECSHPIRSSKSFSVPRPEVLGSEYETWDHMDLWWSNTDDHYLQKFADLSVFGKRAMSLQEKYWHQRWHGKSR